MKTIRILFASVLLTLVLNACTIQGSLPSESDKADSSVSDTSVSDQKEHSDTKSNEEIADLPLLKKLDCIGTDAMIDAVAEADDYVIAVLVRNNTVENNVLTVGYTVMMVDIAKDEIVSRFDAGDNDQLLGVSREENAILLDSEKELVSLYRQDGTILRQFPVDSAVLQYRREDDCLYTLSGTIIRYDLNGSGKTLVKMASDNVLSDIDTKTNTAILSVGSVIDTSPDLFEPVLYSFSDGQVQRLTQLDVFSEYYFCDEGLAAVRQANDYTDYPESQLYLYPTSQQPRAYDTGGQYRLKQMTRSGLFIGTLPSYAEKNTACPVILIDAQNASFANISELGEKDIDSVKYLSESGLIALTVDEGMNALRSLYLIDPEKADFSQKLKASEPEKRSQQPQYSCGDHLKAQREKADALEERFSVEILIGSEIKNAVIGSDYDNISVEEGDFYLTEEEQCHAIDITLDKLERLMSLYGKTFFERFHDFKGEGGLRILLVEKVNSNSELYDAYAYAQKHGGWLYMVLPVVADDEARIDGTFHHELWHDTECYISMYENDAFDFEEWSEMNAAGFQYRMVQKGYEEDENGKVYALTENKDPEKTCVVNKYSCVNEREDRATFIEYLTEDPQTLKWSSDLSEAAEYSTMKDYYFTFPFLKAKYEYMKQYTDKYFEGTYWPFSFSEQQASSDE